MAPSGAKVLPGHPIQRQEASRRDALRHAARIWRATCTNATTTRFCARPAAGLGARRSVTSKSNEIPCDHLLVTPQSHGEFVLRFLRSLPGEPPSDFPRLEKRLLELFCVETSPSSKLILPWPLCPEFPAHSIEHGIIRPQTIVDTQHTTNTAVGSNAMQERMKSVFGLFMWVTSNSRYCKFTRNQTDFLNSVDHHLTPTVFEITIRTYMIVRRWLSWVLGLSQKL
jgi:hypothetical protein